jgi:predicted GH43/DUF377 family glycosyl hydrolase
MEIRSAGIILERTSHEFESQAVLNPACIEDGGVTHMYYRAVKPGNFSSIGYCRLEGSRVIERWDHPILTPEYDYESHGLEDPRIVKIDGLYYLTYTAFDGLNAQFAYAVSEDLTHFEKRGIISPAITYNEAIQIFLETGLKEEYFFGRLFVNPGSHRPGLVWEKDAVLFPEKIDGKFALLHRIYPDIQLALFNDFSELTEEYWRNELRHLADRIILEPVNWFENMYIGAGCPPIRTAAGWLFIYHGVDRTSYGRIYRAGAVLLDLTNPKRVIGRLKEPLLEPREPWEKSGDVNNVVFPTGAVVNGDQLTIYYGAADRLIAIKVFSLSELLKLLIKEA